MKLNPNLRRARLTHEICKTKKTGFYSSEQQRLNGLKGGKVKSDKKVESYAKKLSPAVLDRLNKPMQWKHAKSDVTINLEGGSVKLLADLRVIFANSLPDGEEKQKLINMSTVNFTSAISKVLRGERNKAHNFILIQNIKN